MIELCPRSKDRPIALRPVAEDNEQTSALQRLPLPEGTLPVGVGLLIAGVSSYAFFKVGAAALGKDGFKPISTLWFATFFLAPGFFLPLEQELGRALAHRRGLGQGGQPVVRRVIPLAIALTGIVGLVILIASGQITDRFFEGDWVVTAALVVGFVSYAPAHLARGICSGNGRFASYGVVMGADGASRIIGCLILWMTGVTTTGAYAFVVALAPLVGVGAVVARRGLKTVPGPPAQWSEVTPNLGWRDFPLRDEIGSRVNLPATLDNDANCATLGEFWCGAARGGRNVVGMTIGTGIGGGLILDGKLYHGSSDAAGEIGHTTIDSTGRRCKCGNYGCLEAYASGPAIAERAREALDVDGDSILLGLVDGELSKITSLLVFEASKRGDPVALEVVRDTAHFLGVGIANLINIFNPDIFVIAGGVTQAGDLLFDPMRAEVRRRAFKSSVDACKIVPGSLPLSAGVVGAVATFKAQMLGEL